MAEHLKVHFEEVFSTPKEEAKITDPELHFKTNGDEDVLTDIVFNETDIMKAIDDTGANSAAGPDDIPAIFF